MGEKENKILYRVRTLDPCLARARFNKIEVYENSRAVRVTMICEETVSDELRAKMLDVLSRELPPSFPRIALEVRKIRSDEELISKEILAYIKENKKSVAHSVTLDDIGVDMSKTRDKGGFSGDGGVISFTIALDPDAADQLEAQGAVQEIERHLMRCFCDEFRGNLLKKESITDYSVLAPKPVRIEYINYRSITVEDVTKLDDLIGTSTAVYIDDIRGPMDSVYLCGEIISVRERATSAGKPYYLIEFSDRSAKITGSYFNKKTTEDKVRKLKEGDGIIIQGSLDFFRDRLSLTIRRINYCRFPKDFKPERRPSRSAPLYYEYIFPKHITDYLQKDMFVEEAAPPACLMGKTFVVFDTETTGTEATTEFVTEIGAVKIVDGRVTEVFGSLINPGKKISAEITKLTGIDDAMVADKPSFSQVSGDIYKFFEGAILVAHNADFDMKFLKRLSEPDEYYYYNRYIDTVQFSREVLPSLRNHKLGTVAEHYGIEFHAHRAVDDAYATALVFLKLVEDSGGLPEMYGG